MTDVAKFAEILDHAARDRRAIGRLTDVAPFDVETAYEIQRAVIARREERGERLIGVKMGFTSRAKMVQMGVDDLIWGLLTDAMLVEADVDTSTLIHPRIEPEIVFRIEPGGGHKVAVGYEILDSRYEGFKFTLPDVVADNASAAGFGFGPWHDPRDVANVGLIVEIDGRVVQTGSSAAILGDPIRSLRAAGRLARAAGTPLKPGDIVLAGAATAAIPLPKGAHVRVTGAGLGAAEVVTK
ncbi:2-keto-4-pentenoate hydratase [Spirillospora sp. NPDC127200]